MYMNNPATAANITTFIERSLEDEFLLDNTVTYYKTNELILPNNSIFFDKHKSLIEQYIIDFTLDDNLYNLYKFNPKGLSYKLYNTTALWYLLLWINKITCVQLFNKKQIKVFDPTKLSILTDILANEETYLNNNKYDMGR